MGPPSQHRVKRNYPRSKGEGEMVKETLRGLSGGNPLLVKEETENRQDLNEGGKKAVGWGKKGKR